MIEVLQNLNPFKILAIDIETVRLKENYEDLDEDTKEAWSYKNKHEGEVPTEEDLAIKWKKRAPLYAEFAKVCAVSVAFKTEKGTVRCKSYASEDEKLLLLTLKKDLNKFLETKYILCAHEGKYFDFPFLAKRYVINKIKVPTILDASRLKPWEHSNIDTNEVWKSFGTGPGSSLVALCAAFGLESSKADLVGDEVGRAYFEGNLVGISNYCDLDAVACLNVLLFMMGLDTAKFDEVAYVNRGEIIQPILTTIHQTKTITADQEFVLRELCHLLPVKDIETVRDILEAAMQIKGEISEKTKKFLETL